MSDSLRPHGLQHTRLRCPSASPGARSNSSPLSWWCHPTISSSIIPFFPLPSIFPSIRVFSNESALHIRWPKYWSFNFNISLSSEYSGLISFQIDWLDLFAVKGTLKSLLQYHNSKASILMCSAFFIYSPTLISIHDYWKNHSLDYMDHCWQSNVFAFYTLSRLVITFLPRSKCLFISWLQLPSAVILEPPNK